MIPFKGVRSSLVQGDMNSAAGCVGSLSLLITSLRQSLSSSRRSFVAGGSSEPVLWQPAAVSPNRTLAVKVFSAVLILKDR
jgi:hypothetical protein